MKHPMKHGGKVKGMAEGGKVYQKKMYDAALKMEKEPYSPMDTLKSLMTPKKEKDKPVAKTITKPIAKAKGGKVKCMAKGGGVEVRGKTKGKVC